MIDFKPEVVVFCIQSNELIQLLKPLKEKLPNSYFASSTWGGYQQLLVDFAGPILEDIAVASEFGNMSTSFKKYRESLINLYQIKPTFASGISYSAAKIVLQAIKKM